MESNTPSKRNLQNFNRLHDSHCQYIGRIQGSSLFSFSSGAISLYSDFQFLLLHICVFALPTRFRCDREPRSHLKQISSWGCKQILGDFFKKCEDLILSLISEIAEGKIIWKTIYLVLLFQFVLVFAAYDLKNLNIWPMPESVKYGAKSIFLSKEFHLKTDGSKYPDASGILKDGFTRLLDVITANNIIEFNSKVDESLLLQGINVVILSDSDELKYGIDESYKLLVHANGKQNYAEIEAATVYGALHALQTFSQLCHFYFKSRKLVISQLPWTITDKPRFSYRGLLIDTSHYQPLPMIKKCIDSMSYAKLIQTNDNSMTVLVLRPLKPKIKIWNSIFQVWEL